jgi:hypothetical protein
MPPRRQNERSLQEMEEMRQQIQQLQETVNAQQALLEAQQRRFEDDISGSDSSLSRSSRSHRCQPRMNDIKIDIPDFEGELQPDEFVDWLQAIERVFEYKEIPEEHKVKIVAVKLKKHALIWWENLKRRRKCEGKSKIKTWDKMRRKLTRKYLPPNYYQNNFTQKQLTKKYSYKPLSSTKNHINYHKPLTHQPISSFRPQHNTITKRNTKIPKCFICQGYGHIALDCVNRKVITIVNGEINNIFEEEREDIHESFEEETMGEPIYDEEYVGADICEVFEEERKGDPIYDDEYVPDDIHEVFEKEEKDRPIFDEEYLPAEYGESLEVKRSLQTTTTKEELWLGHDIFNTHFTPQDMACNDIINIRRSENVPSHYIAEKLKSQPIEHQDPCKLQWLNKNNEDVIKIKLTHLPLNEVNEGKEEFKPLEILVPKEPFNEKTKLYMSRPVPKPPWEDVTIDFSLGLLWSRQLKDSKIAVEEKFSRMTHFILCRKFTNVVLRTKKKSLTRGRVFSNPGRMMKNNMEDSRILENNVEISRRLKNNIEVSRILGSNKETTRHY